MTQLALEDLLQELVQAPDLALERKLADRLELQGSSAASRSTTSIRALGPFSGKRAGTSASDRAIMKVPVLALVLCFVGACRSSTPAEEFRLLPLKHRSASELADAVPLHVGPAARAKVTPDPRTNSLLVVGDEEAVAAVEAAVLQLDRPES